MAEDYDIRKAIALITNDANALDAINVLVSQPEWSVSMLEDIHDIVRLVRPELKDPPIYHKH